MADEQRTQPMGEEKLRRKTAKQGRRQAGAKAGKAPAPVTTGDMQEVGALEQHEVAERRRTTDGAPPVHEDPGGQVAG